MKKVLWSLFILLFAAFVIPVLQKAEAQTKANKWTTTRFEIRFFSPFLSDTPQNILDDLKLSTDEKLKLSPLERSLESDLSAIAKYFESQGIDEPNLPIVTKAGVKRYVVFVYDFVKYYGKTSTVGRALHCGEVNVGKTSLGLRTGLTYNLRSIRNWNAKGDRIALYGTLAHELFHAIQRTYDLKVKSLKMCNWKDGDGFQPTVEGTASAAEALVLENESPGYLRSLSLKAEASGKATSLLTSGIGLFPYWEREFLAVKIKKGTPDYGRELEYKTSSFWRYLAERFGGEKPLSVFDKLFNEKIAIPTITQRYRWLNKAVKVEEISGEPLYTLFPEFQAEFASYGLDRYGIKPDKWQKKVYSECAEVKISAETAFYGEAVVGASNRIDHLVKNGARCIKLQWADAKPDDEIKVEAEYEDLKVMDQLHLGVSYLKTAGKADSCYKKILKSPAIAIVGIPNRKDKNLECSMGKVFIKKGKRKYYKPWILGSEDRNKKGDFFARELGATGEAILILTNMADKPEDTKKVEPTESELKIKFSLGRTELSDGRRFYPLKTIQIRDLSNIMPAIPAAVAGKYQTFTRNPFIKTAFPSQSELVFSRENQNIDRYSIYGIKKPSRMLQSGLGSTFQTVSAADPKKKYSIAPLNPNEFKFGRIGPFSGIVANEANAISTLCKSNMGKPIGEITKSDDEQLRFKISTDLCKAVGSEFRKVDSITAEFIFPFGRRAFPETAPQDVITPGLELYIDEYLKELARRGLQLPPTVLLLDGAHPNDVVSSDPDNPSNSTTAPNNKKSDTIKGGCDCSCEAFAKFKKAAEDAKEDPKKRQAMMSAMRCVQSCMQQWGKCPKN